MVSYALRKHYIGLSFFQINLCDVEYIEDICPYATFQLNKQTYSESSYSGNVYSGPYHSVRGSFVYHDVNKPDGYHVSNSIRCFITVNSNLIIFFRQKNQNTQKYDEKVIVCAIHIQKVKVINKKLIENLFLS